MPRNSTLSLTLPALAGSSREDIQSPHSPRSPRRPEITESAAEVPCLSESPNITSLPSLPRSPKLPRHEREMSRSLFGNYKAPKSSTRIHISQPKTIRQVSEGHLSTTLGPSPGQIYQGKLSTGSKPDLSSLSSGEAHTATIDPAERDPPASKRSNGIVHLNVEQPESRKGRPHRFPNLLSRTRSIRADESTRAGSKHIPKRLADRDSHAGSSNVDLLGMKTAPLEKDRGFRDMMNSTNRNRSADRQVVVDSDEDGLIPPRDKKDSVSYPSSSKDNSGNGFLSNIRSSSSKAADGIGRAGRGIFGKLTRSGSANERDHISEETHVFTVITLPLVEQTRRTRISKRLADCRDKTEFWMPALPWRCIDYLNMKGCEEEGIYRIPGSGPKIRHWQMRFDTELDINLFDEPDLYDINIVASMLKAWLRELPDEIFPKATQNKIAERCVGAKFAPQMLKDELSKLPPFNYYLLFAITCHISLLHTNSAKNKMNYHNLCICFQPCMRIDGFCFQFLVCDWKNCWQGCWTEKEFLTEEYRVLGGMADPPASAGRSFATASSAITDERAISSSSSSKPSITGRSTPEHSHPLPNEQPLKQMVDDEGDGDGDGDTPTQNGNTNRLSSHLPVLSPMKPLSPLGL